MPRRSPSAAGSRWPRACKRQDAALDEEPNARVVGAVARDFADFELLPVSHEIEALVTRVDLFATADRRQARTA